jgi:ribosome-associated protein
MSGRGVAGSAARGEQGRVAATPSIPLEEIEIRFVRSSGPGGQNVNKVSTKAMLRWPVASSRALARDVRERFLERFASRITRTGDLVLMSDRRRDQSRNVADCLEKLGAMLAAVAVPPRPRKATRPSAAARERRLADKRAQAAIKRSRRRRAELE